MTKEREAYEAARDALNKHVMRCQECKWVETGNFCEEAKRLDEITDRAEKVLNAMAAERVLH